MSSSDTIQVEILNALRCSLNNRDHFLEDALILPCCHNACKQCIKDTKGREFECEYKGCQKKHKIKNVNKLTANPTVPILLQTHSKHLIDIVKEDFGKLFIELENIEFEKCIDNNIDMIELDIDVKIESLKSELDLISDSMHKKLKELREHMIEMVPSETVESVKQFLETAQCSAEDADLFKYQKLVKDCKQKIKELTQYVPKLPFKASEFEIDEKHIGDIGNIIQIKPSSLQLSLSSGQRLNTSMSQNDNNFHFDRIDSSQFKIISFECLSSVAYLNDKLELIMCDSQANTLRCVETIFYQQIINTAKNLTCPVSICVNNNTNEIYVGDYERSCIVVFNDDFDHLYDFGIDIIQKPFCIAYDEQADQKPDEPSTIYVTDKRNDQVTVWRKTTPEDLAPSLVHKFKCDSAAHIKVQNNKIYVISGIYYEVKVVTKELSRITKGKNCIYIYDKLTYNLLNILKHDGWFDLRGLHVDTSNYIYTTTQVLNGNGRVAGSVYFIRINASNVDEDELRMYLGDNVVRDMVVIDKSIVFVRGKTSPPIQIVDFKAAGEM